MRTTGLVFLTSITLFACSKSAPPEITSVHADPAVASAAPGASVAQPGTQPTVGVSSATMGKGGDPMGGRFTLAEATRDLLGTGALLATIDTSKGTLTCKLFEDKAPVTVANFVGLATGKRSWKDPATDAWVNRPAYDGTTFHRIIKGFMIQGGDAKGNGTGEAGYVIKDEIWEGAKHDRAGLLCMANRGANTNSAQFFITDDRAAHLDGGYTIFGECAPVDTVHAIASVPVIGERPASTVTIKKVTIAREKPAAAPAAKP